MSNCQSNCTQHYHEDRGRYGHGALQHYESEFCHPGLMGIFGGFINLTTSTLQGGARIIKHVVEGSVWHAESCNDYHYNSCSCHSNCHNYHVECVPRSYDCSCCY